MIYDIIFVIQHYCLYPESRRMKPVNALNEESLNENAINDEGRYSALPEPQDEPVANPTTPANAAIEGVFTNINWDTIE
jgi:hypothetical protein